VQNLVVHVDDLALIRVRIELGDCVPYDVADVVQLKHELALGYGYCCVASHHATFFLFNLELDFLAGVGLVKYRSVMLQRATVFVSRFSQILQFKHRVIF